MKKETKMNIVITVVGILCILTQNPLMISIGLLFVLIFPITWFVEFTDGTKEELK